MSKIAFVQNLAFEYLGVMFISSTLKNNGHSVEVFIGNNLKKLSSDVKNYKPDIVGYPCITGNQDWCLKAAAAIKAKMPGAVMVFGGPHPTFFPEIIMEPFVDIVCRGESEKALLELVDKKTNREGLTKTDNCWVKHDGQIIKNDLRPLIENLDILAFPDRELYYKKYPFLNRSEKVFIAGRGCPFKCSYCFNESMQALYVNKGKYMRYRSIQNVIEEIKLVRKNYGMKTVYMSDDTFIINTHWLYGFLEHYKKEINLPLICLVRADLLTQDIVKQLKEANCYSVFFGIESGDEKLRNKILDKNVSNEQIINAAGLLRKYGIKFRTYNMLGIPGETLENAIQTVNINVQIKADFPWCSILQPYPKTRIKEYIDKNNLLNNNGGCISQTFFHSSIINLKQKRELENLQKLFFYAVKFPSFLPIIKILIKLPPNLFFKLLFLISYAHNYRKSENLQWKEFIINGFNNLAILLGY